MATRHLTVTKEPPLLLERVGASVTMTLNRPKALNALNLEMCIEIRDLLLKWKSGEESGVASFIVKGSGGKAFCAGGDVKSIWQDIVDRRKANAAHSDFGSGRANFDIGSGKPGVAHSDFFRIEYEMNYLLATSSVPQVSIWDGIVGTQKNLLP